MSDQNPENPPGSVPPGEVPGLRADALRNRERLVDTAIRVLAERPGAGMDEIAVASGFGRATLYRHFKSRDELIREIQARALGAGEAALSAARLDEDSAPVALRRAIRCLIGIGDRYRVIAGEPALDTGALQTRPAVAAMLFGLIERGQRNGELRPDLPPQWVLPALASLLVLALRQMAAGMLTPDQACDLVATTLLEGLLPSPGGT